MSSGIVCFVLCFGMSGPAEKPAAADSFCTVYERLVENRLQLTEKERAALRLPTKQDLAGLKLYYKRRCKQGNS